MPDIPLVDLGEVGVHNKNEVPRKEFIRLAEELKDAFTRNGFLYFKNHGISKEKLDAALKSTADFFDLPEDVKLRYQTNPKDMNHGYTSPNQEFLGKTTTQELRQSYNIHVLDGKFPDDEVPNMRPSVNDLARDFEELSNRLLKVMAIALDLQDEDYLLNLHRDMFTRKNETVIRFLHYPPVTANITAKGVARLGEHADYGTFTLLFQDDVGGLEVKNTSGQWVEAVPVPDTLLFNVAEMLELWSSGKFPATRHRVFFRDGAAQQQKVRRSVACFVSAAPDVKVQPLDGTPIDKPIIFGEHMRKRYLETYVN